jgi:DNA adenine methylase
MKSMNMIKPGCDSFIGWLGGKTKLRRTIINCIPKHVCYVEVFGGSATVFFGKPPEISRIEIINDVHQDLVNLMKVLAGTCFDEDIRQEFISYVRNMPAARAAFEDWKHWTDDKVSKLTPAQRAFRFYYCVKKGFSSTPTGGYEASPLSNSRYNQKTDFDQFTQRFRCNNAQIECLDFRVLIEKYNRSDADTFFFCDPPYWVANDTNYYEHVFTPDDHNDFKSCIDAVEKNNNKFLITYDDAPEIINLYQDYFIYRTDPITYQAADERGDRELVKTEIFITNYDIAKMVHKRNTTLKRGRKHGDMFATIDPSDSHVEFPGAIGLERIH